MTESLSHKKRSSGWLLWIPLGLLALLFQLPAIVKWYPPNWLERRSQQQQVWERVQAVGGWSALKRDCDALASRYQDDPTGFIWSNAETNALPPAIAALRPKSVQFFSSKALQPFKGEPLRFMGSNVVVRIAIFGAHSTGGHDQPALGLDVLCAPGIVSYRPDRLRSRSPLRYWRYRKITGDIYEYY